MPDLAPLQGLTVVGALVLVGAAKTSFSGLGVVAVALFALALPARESTGTLLPLLLVGDLLAVLFYRRHADWRRLVRLLPWVAVGVLCGALVVGSVDDRQMRRLIGLVLLAVLATAALHTRLRGAAEHLPAEARWLVPLVGLLAGAMTMLANAAGPLMSLYLLAAGLAVLSFLGTSAWFFLVVNAFTLPFSVGLGLISGTSLALAAVTAPAVLVGALAGRVLVERVDQVLFERITLGLTFAAAVRLLL